jgi:hypothetical protein
MSYRLAITAMFASLSFAQTPAASNVDRVFYLTYAETSPQFQEIVTAVRAVTDIKVSSPSIEEKSFIAHGTGEQIKLAEWMVSELNRPAPAPPTAVRVQEPAAHEYRLGDDDIARVLYVDFAQQTQDLQEIATLTRSVADIQRLFINNKLKAMTVRGSASAVAIAEWMVNELNKPVPAGARADSGAPHEYRIPGGKDESVRVFYLAHAQSPHELQQVAVAIRENARIQRLFVNNARKAIAARGTFDQIASAERLVHDFEQPPR